MGFAGGRRVSKAFIRCQSNNLSKWERKASKRKRLGDRRPELSHLLSGAISDSYHSQHFLDCTFTDSSGVSACLGVFLSAQASGGGSKAGWPA